MFVTRSTFDGNMKEKDGTGVDYSTITAGMNDRCARVAGHAGLAVAGSNEGFGRVDQAHGLLAVGEPEADVGRGELVAVVLGDEGRDWP